MHLLLQYIIHIIVFVILEIYKYNYVQIFYNYLRRDKNSPIKQTKQNKDDIVILYKFINEIDRDLKFIHFKGYYNPKLLTTKLKIFLTIPEKELIELIGNKYCIRKESNYEQLTRSKCTEECQYYYGI